MKTLAVVIPGRLEEPNPQPRYPGFDACASPPDDRGFHGSGRDCDGNGGGADNLRGGSRQEPAVRPAISQ